MFAALVLVCLSVFVSASPIAEVGYYPLATSYAKRIDHYGDYHGYDGYGLGYGLGAYGYGHGYKIPVVAPVHTTISETSLHQVHPPVYGYYGKGYGYGNGYGYGGYGGGYGYGHGYGYGDDYGTYGYGLGDYSELEAPYLGYGYGKYGYY